MELCPDYPPMRFGNPYVRRDMVDAYYSSDLKCWVRMERQADGEWCHTSGFHTREEALGRPRLAHPALRHDKAEPGGWVNPCDRHTTGAAED
jgi:hypothetical protein